MSERKALNKYYPPDFDPSKVSKVKKTKKKERITLSLPFSMRCLRCNEYIAERRKFNATKDITNEKYMGVKIIRFHIMCPNCNNHITFKTNPQSSLLFIPEDGAKRNYEPKVKTGPQNPSKPESESEVLERLEKEDIENRLFQLQEKRRKFDKFWKKDEGLKNQEGDVMENLQKKLLGQQREQEINEELASLNERKALLQSKGGSDTAIVLAQSRIDTLQAALEKSLNEQDELQAKKEFAKFRSSATIESDGSRHRKGLVGVDEVQNLMTLKRKQRNPKEAENNRIKTSQQSTALLSLGYSSSEED